MGLVSIAFVAALVLLTVVVSVLVARLMQYRETPVTSREDIDLSRYAPMAHLLDPEEAAFLASQAGSTPQQVRAFRKGRRGIFRSYLRELTADFQALHAEAREIVAVSPEKNPGLVEMLMRLQFQFWFSIARLEAQLVLDAAGMGQVDPRRLLDAVGSLNAAIVQATSVPGPVPIR